MTVQILAKNGISAFATCPHGVSLTALIHRIPSQETKRGKGGCFKGFFSIAYCHLSCLTPPKQPKFLTKGERAKLALAKREQEIKDQQEKDEKRKTERDALERDAEDLRQKELQTSSSKYSRCQCSYLPPLLILTLYQTKTDTHTQSVIEVIATANGTAIHATIDRPLVLRDQETVSRTYPLVLAPTVKSNPPLPHPLQMPHLLFHQ